MTCEIYVGAERSGSAGYVVGAIGVSMLEMTRTANRLRAEGVKDVFEVLCSDPAPLCQALLGRGYERKE